MKRILFGAGKIGRLALEVLKNEDAEYYFCDNYNYGNEVAGIKTLSFSEAKEIYDSDTEMIITTAYVYDVYRQCLTNNIKVLGVFDEKTHSIKDYYTYCLDRKIVYGNDKMHIFFHNKNEMIDCNVDKFIKGAPLIECISEVAIMISNICNYSFVHKKCPAAIENKKEIMSIGQIRMIVESLKKVQFSGTICFHIYNEPTNDPRLFWIIQYVKMTLPEVKILVYTNGFYLTNVTVREFEEIGTDVLITTAYGDEEYRRLMSLNVNIAFQVLYGYLDDRLLNYDGSKKKIEIKKCRSLLAQLPIYVNGDIGLCCLDYRHNNQLGNVFTDGFECINSDKIRDFQLRLLEGESTYQLCTVCGWNMWDEYMKTLIVCGAGALGKFVVSQVLPYTECCYKKIYFFDNNPNLHGKDILGFRVMNENEVREMGMKEKIDIIIATEHWRELYEQVRTLGLLDFVVDIVTKFTYKSMEYLNRSVAQDGEDLFLESYFAGQDEGFYVDIGAHHPLRFSNTAWAYKKGWHGINVEPNEEQIGLFDTKRKRDSNLRIGCAGTEGKLQYYKYEEPALNSFTPNNYPEIPIIETEEIYVKTLAQILEEQGVAEIDLLSIDVEGKELEILQSNNWDKWKPRVIVVEQFFETVEEIMQDDIYKLLEHYGYSLAGRTSRNSLYIYRL